MRTSTRIGLGSLTLGLVVALASLAQPPNMPMHPQGPMGPQGGMGPWMMGGQGTMGPGMMGGGCPMLGFANDAEQVKVENLKDGVRLSLTSNDAKAALRLQKRAEIMRLMHELHEAE